jgi:hypothetical protein
VLLGDPKKRGDLLDGQKGRLRALGLRQQVALRAGMALSVIPRVKYSAPYSATCSMALRLAWATGSSAQVPATWTWPPTCRPALMKVTASFSLS